jgi:hypothetical protein
MAESSSTLGKSSGDRARKGKVSAKQGIAGQQEQWGLASKANDLELESSQHSLVTDTLKEINETHQCCRLVGGMLVEQIVEGVHSF